MSCTRREFIRAALSMVKKRSRFSRELREMRHKWLREGLQYHDSSIEEFYRVTSGR